MRYIGKDGREYTLEEINNMGSAPPTSLVEFAGRNLDRTSSNSQQLSALHASFANRNADQAARTEEAARILNIDPALMVGASREMSEAAANVARMKINSPTDWQQFVQEYPKTANYLSDGKNMAMSHDDIKALTETENTIKNTLRLDELRRQRAEIGLRLQGENDRLDRLNEYEYSQLKQIDEEMKALSLQLPQTTWSPQGLLSGLVGITPSLVVGAKYAAAGATTGAVYGSVVPGAGTVGGAATGAAAGFRIGMAKDFSSVAMGNAYLDYLIQDAENPMMGAVAVGGMQAVLGSVQVGRWLKIPQNPGVKNFALSTAEQAIYSAGFGVSEVVGRNVAQGEINVTPGDLSNIATQTIEEIPINMVMLSPSYGVAGLKRLGQTADNSKTAKRSPATYAENVNNSVAGSPLAETYINGRGLVEHLSSVPPDKAQSIIDSLRITPDNLAEAVATGGDIRITPGEYAILDSATREAISRDIRVSDEPTIREVDARRQEYQELVKRRETAQEGGETARQANISELDLNAVEAYAEAVRVARAETDSIIESYNKRAAKIETEKAYIEQVEAVRREIAEQIETDPVYRASDSLAFDLQLFGAKDIKRIARKYREGTLTDEQRFRFDDIAEENGLIGDDLAQKIVSGRDKAAEIDHRVNEAAKQIKRDMIGDRADVEQQARANDAYIAKSAIEAETIKEMGTGKAVDQLRQQREAEVNKRWADAEKDLLLRIQKAKDDAKAAGRIEQIREKAKEKLLNQKSRFQEQIEKLETELAEVKKKRQTELDELKDQNKLAREWLKSEGVSQRIARQGNIGKAAVKQMAKDIVDSKTIGELKDGPSWKKYMALSQRANTDSERAYRQGRYEEAARFKTQEMLNQALVMEAARAEMEIKKIERQFKPYINRGRSLKGMPAEFTGQIDRLLAEYGLSDRPPAQLPGEQIPSLREFADNMKENYHIIAIPDTIMNEAPRPFGELNLDRYKDLRAAVTTIAMMGRKYDRFNSAWIKLGISEAATETRKSIEREVGNPYIEDFGPGSQFRSKAAEKIANMTRVLDELVPSQVNVLTLARYLDGDKDNGPMQRFVYNVMARAEDTKIRMMDKAKAEVSTMFNDYYGKPGNAEKQRNERVYFDHVNRYFTREEILMIGMNWGNDGNRDRIMRGFGWVDANGSYDFTKVKPILDTLTKKDWDFTQRVWDYLDTFWPEIQRLEMEVAGTEAKKVVPSGFTVVDTDYKGGYFPISYDYNKSIEAYKTMEQKNALYKQGSAAHAMTEHGHTEARSNSNNRPINLSMDVFFRHLDNVIHDLSHREAVIDVNRFINHTDTRTAITNAVGMDGFRTIDNWLKSIASDQGDFITSGEQIAQWFRYKTTFVGMGFRVSMLPIDSIGNFMNGVWEIGAPRMTKALGEYAVNPSQIKSTVIEKSAFMRNRAMIRERDLWDLSNKWYKNDSGLKNFAFATMAWSDEVISVPLWAERFKDALGQGLTEMDAVITADNAVKRAIGSGSKLDQVGAQKGGEYKKLTSMYYSWASMMFNRMWLASKRTGVQWRAEDRLAAVQTMSKAMFFGFIAQGLVDGIIRETMRNEDRKDKEDAVKRVATRVFSQPISYLWIGRDIGQAAMNMATGEYGDYQLSPIESQLNSTLRLIPATHRLYTGDIEPTEYAERASRALAPFTGIPSQVNAWAFNFLDWINGNGEATWKDFMTRRQKK